MSDAFPSWREEEGASAIVAQPPHSVGKHGDRCSHGADREVLFEVPETLKGILKALVVEGVEQLREPVFVSEGVYQLANLTRFERRVVERSLQVDAGTLRRKPHVAAFAKIRPTWDRSWCWRGTPASPGRES